MDVKDVLKLMVAAHASDLNIKAGSPPTMRVGGKLSITDEPALSSEDMGRIAGALVPEGATPSIFPVLWPVAADAEGVSVGLLVPR